MEEPRPILYGVSDYAQIRRKNAWFVDRTAKIRDLEMVAYAVFLRPRRFGKSLFVSILEAYYDIRYADRFEELFGGTDIGANPTEEHNKYLILRFDFSAVAKDLGKVQEDFDYKASLQCDVFANKSRGNPPARQILRRSDLGRQVAAKTWWLRHPPPPRPRLPRRRLRDAGRGLGMRLIQMNGKIDNER